MNVLDYVSISAELATKFPQIKHINLFNGQYQTETPKNEHPVNYPAVYIEFLPTQWQMATGGMVEGDAQVRIHIVLHSMKDVGDIHTKSSVMQNAILEHYTLANNIAAGLEGFFPCTALTALRKTEDDPDNNHDQIIVERYTYAYTILDTTNADFKTQIDKVIQGFLVTGTLENILKRA